MPTRTMGRFASRRPAACCFARGISLASVLPLLGACEFKDVPDSAVPDDSARVIDYGQFVDQTTSWGTDMVRIPAGTFTMGGGVADLDDLYTDHQVTLTHDFWMGQSEVTQAEWAQFAAAEDPAPSSGEPCEDCPVTDVSWIDAVVYLNALAAEEGLDPCYVETDLGARLADAYFHDPYECPGYRLPTEAEWEYAARAGEDTEFSGSNKPSDVAWWEANSDGRVHPRRLLAPNAWGVCDMSGNVGEWANDAYESYGGDGAPLTDPAGPEQADRHRIPRGGGWDSEGADIDVASRFGITYFMKGDSMGFRLARSVLP